MTGFLLRVLSLILVATPALAGERLLEDHFERSEQNDQEEQVGNGWGTNSASRAKGNKQVDLVDGALKITRHPVADHGVSVVHDLEFKDATISLRFRIGEGDQLGINIADMKEKSVHAGHLCVAKIRLNKLTLMDLKTGRMNLETRDRSKAGKLTAEDRKRIAAKQKEFPLQLSADTWHDLQVDLKGETMTVQIDGSTVGQFLSPGIGHPTKSRLRLAVEKQAWVDDVTVDRNDS
ncbi:family 16 glycoside hydrolase [Roseiconus nitratireducens]|nr:family 16 glycoside hydrolase [Roseiconus nitratireducens]